MTPRMRHRRPSGILVLALLAAACPDEQGPRKQPTFHVPIIDLRMPKLSGWRVDESVGVDDPAKGGEIFRLVRQSAVPGSPRIMVMLEPLRTSRTQLESFLTQSLREMAQRESTGSLRIVHVDQRPFKIGGRGAYRVKHEYTVGVGTSQIAITQVATLLVLDGRGITITAAGRTELFHPIAESVEMILRGVTPAEGGIATSAPGKGPGDRRPINTKAKSKSLVEPIDLGRVGGRK